MDNKICKTLEKGGHRFCLRKFKYVKEMSQETDCFTAELWVDGRKLATCANDGHGGATSVDILPGQENKERREMICRDLAACPKIKWPGSGFKPPCTLETIVDLLVEKELEAKAVMALQRKTVSNLVFKDVNGNYYSVCWKRTVPIAKLLLEEKLRDALRLVIRRETEKGATLLNENIPAELIYRNTDKPN